jgi:type II secretory pathway pseudopilin PulG
MKFLRFLGSEIILGTLIALLSVLTAVASWQGSIADSKQNESEVRAMQQLNDGNAEYLSANQFIVYDYTMYDGWYTTDSEDKAAYYEASYSEELQNAIATNPDEPFSDEYYAAMYASANGYWDESDANFELAGQWDNRGDGLQLVMLVMALGLAFAAWASLLKEESNMRLLFSVFAIITLVIGVITYLNVPTVIS